MTVNLTWVSPAAAGPLDLATGAAITETWVDGIASNLLVLGGTTGLVHTGAYTITQGLQVQTGGLGLGSSVAGAATALSITMNTLAGPLQIGVLSAPLASASATAGITGVYARPDTAALAFTASNVICVNADTPTKGPGSTITTVTGVLVAAMTTGNTNNYGVDILTPSGGSGDNLSLRASGAVRLSGLSGFVASDHYVVIDASGNLHKSAIGPAS